MLKEEERANAKQESERKESSESELYYIMGAEAIVVPSLSHAPSCMLQT